MSDYDYKAVDAVVNIWNKEALSKRPGWGDDFFQKKMNSTESSNQPIEIDQLIEILDDAGIEKAFLIAAYSGRIGLRSERRQERTKSSVVGAALFPWQFP